MRKIDTSVPRQCFWYSRHVFSSQQIDLLHRGGGSVNLKLSLLRQQASSSAQLGLITQAPCCRHQKKGLKERFLSATSSYFLSARKFSPATKKSSIRKTSSNLKRDTVESIYKKKTQREHVLLRPEPYIGSTQWESTHSWTIQDPEAHAKSQEAGPIVSPSKVSYVPAIVQLFDEILVNACDNRYRKSIGRRRARKGNAEGLPDAPDSMTQIRVVVDDEANKIVVFNDGPCVPVAMHSKEKLYVPTLVFGHLLTSSNYDDTIQRITGGRHGFGAKLTNIFSTNFTVEIFDGLRRKFFHQTFSDNMSSSSAPLVKDITNFDQIPESASFDHKSISGPFGSNSWMQVSFSPDLKRFKNGNNEVLSYMGADTISVMKRRVFDIAGCCASFGVKVFYNGNLVPIRSMEHYVSMYPQFRSEAAVSTRLASSWTVAVAANSSNLTLLDGPAMNQVSFVNGISTPRGGTHVAWIVEEVVKAVSTAVSRGSSGRRLSITPGQIRPHICVFVDAIVPNPSFDSQCKDSLITPLSVFAKANVLPPEYLKEVIEKTGIMEAVVEAAETKQRKDLMKTSRTSKGKRKSKWLVDFPKLEDANWAGTSKSGDTTLILTEGDSAKALAVAGLAVVGRDRYGVYPLKGKLLNVREASHSQIVANKEFSDIISIVGLRHGKDYSNPEERKQLRYGRILLMADRDHDGCHIKGLFINILHFFWPELLKSSSFLQEFITPIVKVSKGKKERRFYSLGEYRQWQKEVGSAWKSFDAKYYKGLGTSTAAEAQMYFKDIEEHVISYEWGGDEDHASVALAFSKMDIEKRKLWVQSCGMRADERLDLGKINQITISQFVHHQLILFSHADNVRSIPSVMDGLKPGQRKVLYACFLRNLVKDTKVAQLAGYVSEKTQYHHGEAALHGTIVNMAQDFVGSNNCPLLVPSGQFGTRHMGGKDSASPRYIFTRLDPAARLIFRGEDDSVLQRAEDEGEAIEPVCYAPVIPMLLVNGGQGIGTGFSSLVPPFHPLDVIENIRAKIRGKPQKPLVPWIRGHKVGIRVQGKSCFGSQGLLEIFVKESRKKLSLLDLQTASSLITSKHQLVVRISELPAGRWTQIYKSFLQNCIISSGEVDKKKAVCIQGFSEHHTHHEVEFQISMSGDQFSDILARISCGEVDEPEKSDVVEAEAMEGLNRNLQTPSANEPNREYCLQEDALMKVFRLTAIHRTSNMHAFAPDNSLKKYSDPREIIDDYFDFRLDLYQTRKDCQMAQLLAQEGKLANQVRFVESAAGLAKGSGSNSELKIGSMTTGGLVKELASLGFLSDMELEKMKLNSRVGPVSQALASKQHSNNSKPSFNYLLNMPMGSMSKENLEVLQQKQLAITAKLEVTRKTPAAQLWAEDLSCLEAHLRKRFAKGWESANN